MDATLAQILSALFVAHQTIDALQKHVAALEAQIKERDTESKEESP